MQYNDAATSAEGEDSLNIEKVVVGQLDVNCYIVTDGSTPAAAIIDPGDEAERIACAVDARGLRPAHIVFTHAHYDHVCAVRELKDRYNGAVVMHEDECETYRLTKQRCIAWGYEPEDFPLPDRLVRESDELVLGGLVLKVLHTPGHTPGGICLYGGGAVFTGDTLFKGAVGRTDLQGGDAGRLLASLARLSALPHNTAVYCGHGDPTTIGLEVERNPYLNKRSGLRFFA